MRRRRSRSRNAEKGKMSGRTETGLDGWLLPPFLEPGGRKVLDPCVVGFRAGRLCSNVLEQGGRRNATVPAAQRQRGHTRDTCACNMLVARHIDSVSIAGCVALHSDESHQLLGSTVPQDSTFSFRARRRHTVLCIDQAVRLTRRSWGPTKSGTAPVGRRTANSALAGGWKLHPTRSWAAAAFSASKHDRRRAVRII